VDAREASLESKLLFKIRLILLMQTFLFQTRHVKAIVAFIFFILPFYAHGQTGAVEQRYSSIRAEKIIKPQMLCDAFGLTESADAILALQKEVLAQSPRSAHLDSKNPEWQRLKKILDSDISPRQGFDKLLERSKKLVNTELDELLPEVVGRYLSKIELEQILNHYSQSGGMKFSKIQPELFEALDSGISRVRAMMLNRALGLKGGEQPQKFDAPEAEIEQTLSLFDEYVRIQWARSPPQYSEHGTRTTALLAASGVSQNYSKITEIWNRLSDTEKLEVLEWRKSAIALREREALAKIFAETRASTCGTEKTKVRKTKILADIKEKWMKQIDTSSQIGFPE
jgi:hypothetical protein